MAEQETVQPFEENDAETNLRSHICYLNSTEEVRWIDLQPEKMTCASTSFCLRPRS
jgi:hypothetical protein